MARLHASIIVIPRPHIRVPRVLLKTLMRQDTRPVEAHPVAQP